jgi:hypothetical protein
MRAPGKVPAIVHDIPSVLRSTWFVGTELIEPPA